MKQLGQTIRSGALAGLLVALPLVAQKSAASAEPAAVVASNSGPIEVLRVIEDPANGVRWFLLRDATHPGGPGRLVREIDLAESKPAGPADASPSKPAIVTRQQPVIRGGDKLIVEEHTAIADAVFEAIAVTPAVLGAPLDVRLRLGGKVVRAYAAGPGRASMQPLAEARP